MTLVIKDGNGANQNVKTQTFGTDQVEVVLPALGSTITGGAPARVAQSVTDGVLVAANTARIRAHIYNDTTAGNLLVSYGAAATATGFTVSLAPGSYHIVDDYTGAVHGLWDAAGSGGANVTEITA